MCYFLSGVLEPQSMRQPRKLQQQKDHGWGILLEHCARPVPFFYIASTERSQLAREKPPLSTKERGSVEKRGAASKELHQTSLPRLKDVVGFVLI